MKIISRQGLAAEAADRWKQQYFNSMTNTWRYTEDKEITYNKLVSLGRSPNPGDVNAVIGNESWTRVICDECGSSVEEVVQLGEELDYESATANICFNCLKDAVELIEVNQ